MGIGLECYQKLALLAQDMGTGLVKHSLTIDARGRRGGFVAKSAADFRPHFIKCGGEGWGEFYDLWRGDFTIFRLTVLRIYGIIRGIFWRYYAV